MNFPLQIWKATVVSHSPTEWVVQNMPWDADLKPGEDLLIEFNGHISGDQAPTGTYSIQGTFVLKADNKMSYLVYYSCTFMKL